MGKRRWQTLDQRRLDNQSRIAAWQALSAAQQLLALDARLGVGQGAQRQRKRLAKPNQ